MGSLGIEILASIGVALIAVMLYCFFRRSVKMDRMLAKGEFNLCLFGSAHTLGSFALSIL